MNPAATSSGLCGRPVAASISRASFGESAQHDAAVERLVAARAKDPRKVFGLHTAQHHVRIGQSKRPAAPVARRPGVRAGRIGADAQPCAVKMQDRSAARGHRVDAHHRRAHAHAGNERFEFTLVLAGEVRDVSGGASHVEADHAVETGPKAGARHADNAAGRPRQDRVLSLKAPRIGETAVALHEEQPSARQLGGDLTNVSPQDRRQVGIDHRRVAARHELH